MLASNPAGWMSRACSESPVSALHVEMCMVQHLLLSALGVGCRSRPIAEIGSTLECCNAGSQKPTFAASAKVPAFCELMSLVAPI
jgi:hypothetical protein